MARQRSTVPTYQRHSSGRARVRTYDAAGNRIEIVLPGDYGSEESKQEYERVLARLRTGDGKLPVEKKNGTDLTVNELVAQFMTDYVEGHYRRPDGTPTGEKANWTMSVRPLVRLYGAKLASEFTPLDLRIVRDSFITGSWMTCAGPNCDRTCCQINAVRISRSRRAFCRILENFGERAFVEVA